MYATQTVVGSHELDFEQTWGTLESALRDMNECSASQLSFETIYRHAYKVVLKKKGDNLYKNLEAFQKAWLSEHVGIRLLRSLTSTIYGAGDDGRALSIAAVNEMRTTGEKLLRGIKDSFEHHQVVMRMSSDVFMYLVSSH